MKLLAITCGRCGAPLDVPTGVSSVTCEYCRSHLLVERRDGRPATAVAGGPNAPPRASREPHSPELDRIDRDRLIARQEFMIRGSEGELRVPNRTAAVAGAAMAAIAGIFLLRQIAETPFKILAAVFIAVAVVTGATSFLRAQRYLRARDDYGRHRRAALQTNGARADLSGPSIVSSS